MQLPTVRVTTWHLGVDPSRMNNVGIIIRLAADQQSMASWNERKLRDAKRVCKMGKLLVLSKVEMMAWWMASSKAEMMVEKWVG
jgi:hypothetical protein